MTEVFVEQPLASPGSAKFSQKCTWCHCSFVHPVIKQSPYSYNICHTKHTSFDFLQEHLCISMVTGRLLQTAMLNCKVEWNYIQLTFLLDFDWIWGEKMLLLIAAQLWYICSVLFPRHKFLVRSHVSVSSIEVKDFISTFMYLDNFGRRPATR